MKKNSLSSSVLSPAWQIVMNELNRKALTAGKPAVLMVVTGIWLGSQALTHFDPALIWSAIGSILAAFALAYRFTVWAQRPPSRFRRIHVRGRKVAARQGPRLLLPFDR